MKVLFTLVLLAGFGFWMVKEIQHEQELQAQLDEARQDLAEAQKQLQTTGHAARQSGSKSWMWESNDSNPLNAPPVPSRSQ